MTRWKLSHCALFLSAAAATWLTACGGSQAQIGALGAMPQSRAVATQAERSGSRIDENGPFLYVGGIKLLMMYVLGSSKPLHVAKTNPSTVLSAAIALDLHGHLCEANGEISYPQLFEYDARTLKFLKGSSGVDYPTLGADHLGYVFSSQTTSTVKGAAILRLPARRLAARAENHQGHEIRQSAGGGPQRTALRCYRELWGASWRLDLGVRAGWLAADKESPRT